MRAASTIDEHGQTWTTKDPLLRRVTTMPLVRESFKRRSRVAFSGRGLAAANQAHAQLGTGKRAMHACRNTKFPLHRQVFITTRAPPHHQPPTNSLT